MCESCGPSNEHHEHLTQENKAALRARLEEQAHHQGRELDEFVLDPLQRQSIMENLFGGLWNSLHQLRRLG